MNRLHPRTLKLSWPVQGLLLVTIALIAFTWWRGAQHDAPASGESASSASVSTPRTIAARPNPAASSGAASAGPGAAGAPSAPPGSAASASDAASAVSAATETFVDLFPSQSWAPPPPPPPPPTSAVSSAPLPPPEPPPLPFVVRSLWLSQGGDFYVVLNAAGRDFPLCGACQKKGFLHKGDVVLNAYRIEAISRDDVRFLYLPLKRRQQLSLGGAK